MIEKRKLGHFIVKFGSVIGWYQEARKWNQVHTHQSNFDNNFLIIIIIINFS